MGLIDEITAASHEEREALFNRKLYEYTGHINGSQGFGSQKEKTVHSFLKSFYSGNPDYEEVMSDGFICDVLKEDNVIEIQSKYFYRLREKLLVLLEKYKVMIVFPVAHQKTLEWISPVTGEIVSRKKSPKKGDIYDFLPEAYGIRDLLKHPNLSFCISLIDITESKLLDGYGKERKIRSTKYDRRPERYHKEYFVSDIKDYVMFVPHGLETFDRQEYAKAVKLNQHDASTALTLLSYLGVVEKIGVRNRKYIYKIKE